MRVTEKYLCPVCRARHDGEGEAKYCCPREVASVYVCGECDTQFFDDELREAEACCVEKVRAREEAERVCFYCNGAATPDDVRESRLLGSHTRCRACIGRVAPDLIAA